MPFSQRISQIPNPSLALQASMARAVSFSNAASASGGGIKLKLGRSFGRQAEVSFFLRTLGSRQGGLEATATTRFPIWYFRPRLEQFRSG